MIDITRFVDVVDNVIVTCTDGTRLEGVILSVDDEEESGLGEMGISFNPVNGGYIGIGQSEIESIEIVG